MSYNTDFFVEQTLESATPGLIPALVSHSLPLFPLGCLTDLGEIRSGKPLPRGRGAVTD
jgi:hypothetical protein